MIGVFVVMICLGLLGCDRFKAQPVRWEYYVTWGNPGDPKNTAAFNEWGSKGWELVAVVPADGGGQPYFFFKRRVP